MRSFKLSSLFLTIQLELFAEEYIRLAKAIFFECINNRILSYDLDEDCNSF